MVLGTVFCSRWDGSDMGLWELVLLWLQGLTGVGGGCELVVASGGTSKPQQHHPWLLGYGTTA